MASIRWANSVLVCAAEAVAGTEQAPSTANGIACQNIKFAYNGNVLKSKEYTGSLDRAAAAVGAVKGRLSFDIPLKGSTAAATLPEWSTLVSGVDMQVTTTGAAVPVAPEACAAGGSTTTAVLGASASSTDQIYRGMPITFSGVVAGTTIITDYVGSTKTATLADIMSGAIVATTSYQVLKNIMMQPVTPNPAAWLTIHHYVDGKRRRFFGCQGNLKGSLIAGDIPLLSFDMAAYGFLDEDTAMIAPAFDATRPPVWKGGVAAIDRLAAALKTMTFDLGNVVAIPDDPNGPQGIGLPEITGRDVNFTLDPKMTLVATRDVIGRLTAGTPSLLHARAGSVVGNRWALTCAQGFPTTYSEGDNQGIATNSLGFNSTTKNAALQLTLY